MGKRGPQPKGEYRDKSAVLSTRISAELRLNLENAARESGSTLSREIEHRLRRTFLEDMKIELAFGNAENFALMRMIGGVAAAMMPQQDRDSAWTSDPRLFDMVAKAMASVMESIRPRSCGP